MVIADFFIRVWAYIAPVARGRTESHDQHWLGMFAHALEPFHGGDELAKKQCLQLMKYGARRCPNFLSRQPFVPPFFELNDLTTLLSLVNSHEEGIGILRGYVKSLPKDRLYIIRYPYGWDSQRLEFKHEYATACPVSRPSKKRTSDGLLLQGNGHVRWVNTLLPEDILSSANSPLDHTAIRDDNRVSFTESQGEIAHPVEAERIKYFHSETFRWKEIPKFLISDIPEPSQVFASSYIYEDATFSQLTEEGPGLLQDSLVLNADFKLIAGNPNHVALFQGSINRRYPRGPAPLKSSATPSQMLDLTVISSHLEKRTIHAERLMKFLDDIHGRFMDVDTRVSLRGLAMVCNIYKMLPNSLVAMSVTSHCLASMPWVPAYHLGIYAASVEDFRGALSLSSSSLDIGRTFACIAFFESGSCAVGPNGLESVMAMATGDSIYIAAALLCDPSETLLPYEVRRIRGNIGKPGIAMLISPKETPQQHTSPDWRVVNHNTFDGQIEDSFQSTSLHLRFTDYVFPIDIGAHGLRDFEVYFLESVVSVHDRGQWIADVDILNGLSSPLLQRVPAVQCTHSASHESELAALRGNQIFTMVDDWNELLDRSNNACIVRSANNWLGRLATLAYSVQNKYPTIVLPGRFCWSFIRTAWDKLPVFVRTMPGGTLPPKLGTHGYLPELRT